MAMRPGVLLGLALVLCGGGAAGAQGAAAFNGPWDVTADCPDSPNGDPAFFYAFKAEVSGDVIHGEHGTAGQPGWLAIDGVIQADGTANLQATGLTNPARRYNAHDGPQGVRYRYPVAAHFDPSHGSGRWTAERVCNLTFVRP
jgi:hypothetical protein